MRRTVVAAMMAAAMTGGLSAQKKDKVVMPPVAVYIVPAAEPTAFVDAALQQRIDSTKDLIKAAKKAPMLRLVDTREAAQVVLQVVARDYDWRVFSDERQQAPLAAPYVVVVRLTVGDYTTDMVGRTRGRAFEWSHAAEQACGMVVQWIKDNRLKIPAVPASK